MSDSRTETKMSLSDVVMTRSNVLSALDDFTKDVRNVKSCVVTVTRRKKTSV